MGKLEHIIKENLKKEGIPKRLGNCPSEIELSKYLDGSLAGQQKEKVENHLSNCAYCLDLLVTTREILKSHKRPEASMLKILKKEKWLILTIVGFLLSFFVKRFFLQFLFLSLILGIKWALGNEGSKNLVMIFRSLQHQDTEKEEHHNAFGRK